MIYQTSKRKEKKETLTYLFTHRSIGKQKWLTLSMKQLQRRIDFRWLVD